MSSVVGDSQISLIWCWKHLINIAVILLAEGCSELYFACSCALKRTGKFVLESKFMC